MKYHHQFILTEDGGSKKIYQSEDNIVRLDFFENMMRISMYKEGSRLFPTYSVCPGDSVMPRHGRDRLSTEGLNTITPNYLSQEGKDVYTIGEHRIEIDMLNFRMSYYESENMLFQDREYISYNFENELGNGTTHYITREKDEHIYGLGDKSGNINKNRRHFRMETFDAMGYDALSSDPLYKQIPFYICRNSVGTYGIYYDTYCSGEFDFGQELNNYYGIYKYFHSDDEALVFYVFFGNINSILHDFSYLTGKTMFAPKWTLKYGGSTMSYTDAPDAENQLRNFVSLCKEYGIDCGGFYLSSGYTQIGTKRYVFHWNKEKIPDPKGLSSYFKDNGIEFLPNIKPAFLTDHPLYQQIADKGWFLHYKDGTPAVFPFWSGMGSYFDFTNDEAFDFWTRCVKEQLVDLGYRNIWNDNNEYDIHDDTVYAAGFGNEIQAVKIRPLFSLLMTMSSLEAQNQEERHMSVTRSGIIGLQRIAQTWTGDNNTSFKEFRGNHKIAMTMSLSGLYHFGQDIGGFAGPRPGKELFMRWLQYGMFTPRFVLHSWNPDGSSTMPWLYPEMMPAVKKIFDMRTRLIPYLYSTMYYSCEEYSPMIYPIFLKYPGYDEESDFFMVGDSILACPVFDEGTKEITIDLPGKEEWYHKGQAYKGKVTLPAPIDDIPVFFIREGSIMPTQENGKTAFVIYPSHQGKTEYRFFDDDGVSKVKDPHIITIDVSFTKERISIDCSEPIDIRLAIPDQRKVYIRNK